MKAMKKVLAMVLALAMIVTAVPVTNAAADTANLKAGKTVSKSYFAGRVHTLKLNGVKASNITKTTWKSSNTAYVKCITDTKTKTSTDIWCVKKGTATVTAKVTLKNKKTKTYKAKITVKATTLTVSQEEISLKIGESKNLTVTYQPKSAKVTYSSNNPAVATVAHGKVTATGAGDTRIVVKLTCGKKTIKREVLVSVEPAAEGLNAWLANPIVDEMPKTVMVNDDAVINVQYIKGGKPMANTAVILKIDNRKCWNGNGRLYYEVADQQVITDENGMATFIITRDKNLVRPDDDTYLVSRIVYKAVVPSDGAESAEEQVDFAAVTLANVNAGGKLAPGEEFAAKNINCDQNHVFTGRSAVVNSRNMGTVRWGMINYNNQTINQYIMSQQVSEYTTKLTDEHEVSFDGGYPQITFPEGAADTSAAQYQKDPVDHTSDPYGVYGYKTEIYTYPLKVNPTQLTLATLNFEKVSISEHTRMIVRTYRSEASAKGWANNADLRDEKVYVGPLEDAHFGYQVPLDRAYNGNLTVAIKIESQGQVDLGMNAGYTLKDVDYVLRTNTTVGIKTIPIVGSKVEWEMVDSYYTAEEVLYPATGAERTVRNGSANITIPKGGYVTRKVPAMPREGNAILTVYDINHKVVAYYAQATANHGNNTNTTAVAGDISGDCAVDSLAPWTYMITEEEVADLDKGLLEKGMVTIRPDEDGRKVWVNSAVSGRMNLKATISVPAAYQRLFDDENKYFWTFVQWNPTPYAGTNNSDFEALIGQYIDVYAQLYDKNDNKVTRSGVAINFTGGGSGAVYLGLGDVLNGTAYKDGNNTKRLGKATVVSVDGYTNSQGQAKLTLLASEYTELLNIIATTTATTMYNVKLIVGGKTLNTGIGANLWWSRADIGLVPCTNGDCAAVNPSTDTHQFDRSYTVYPNVGTNWEYGLKVYGHRKVVKNNAVVDEAGWEIGGLDLQMKQVPGTVGDAKAIGASRLNVITATSPVAGTTSVNATIDDKSVVGPLTMGKAYAGRDVTSERKNYKLNIQWGAFGLAVKFETVNGNRIYDGAADAAVTTWETIYVKVTGLDGVTPVENTKVRLNIKTNNGEEIIGTDDELVLYGTGVRAFPGTTAGGGTDGHWYTVAVGQIDAGNPGANELTAAQLDMMFTDSVSKNVESGVYTTTDKYGIARVVLKHTKAANANPRPTVTVVTAVAEGLGEVASMPYYWVDVTQMNGGLSLSPDATADGTAYKTSYNNNTGVVTLEFTSNIVPTSVVKEMFKVEYKDLAAAAIELKVADVTVSNNIVSLTLRDKVTNMTANSLINVTMKDYTVLKDPTTGADTKVEYVLTSVNGARYTNRVGAGATVPAPADDDTIFTIDMRKTPAGAIGNAPAEDRAFEGQQAIAAAVVEDDIATTIAGAKTQIGTTAGLTWFKIPVETTVGGETAETTWTISNDAVIDFDTTSPAGLYGATATSTGSTVRIKVVGNGVATLSASTTYRHDTVDTATGVIVPGTPSAPVANGTWVIKVVSGKITSIVATTTPGDTAVESNETEVLNMLAGITLVTKPGTPYTVQVKNTGDTAACTGASISWSVGGSGELVLESGADTAGTNLAWIGASGAKDIASATGTLTGEPVKVVVTVKIEYYNITDSTAAKKVTIEQSWTVTVMPNGSIYGQPVAGETVIK